MSNRIITIENVMSPESRMILEGLDYIDLADLRTVVDTFVKSADGDSPGWGTRFQSPTMPGESVMKAPAKAIGQKRAREPPLPGFASPFHFVQDRTGK